MSVLSFWVFPKNPKIRWWRLCSPILPRTCSSPFGVLGSDLWQFAVVHFCVCDGLSMAKTRSFPEQQGNSWYFGVRPRTREEVVLRRSGYRFFDSSFFTGDPAWGWVSIHSLFRHRAKCSKACDCGCKNLPWHQIRIVNCLYVHICVYTAYIWRFLQMLSPGLAANSCFHSCCFMFGHKRDCVQGLQEKKGHVNEFLTPVAASHGTGRTVRHRCFFVCFVFFIFHVVLLMFSSLSMLFLFQYYVPLFFSFLLLLF